ncbi:hypothetical protein LEP1GSC100_1260 [Leptospira interrogans serovar Bataviae str. UI 08561]|nr:hypothetical protein LEP1GSC100_1260 [Leptospira interrogans serovar Bataviae str. UI 08561]
MSYDANGNSLVKETTLKILPNGSALILKTVLLRFRMGTMRSSVVTGMTRVVLEFESLL